MPSVLRPNHKFLASPAKSGYFLSIFSTATHRGVSQHLVFLMVFFVPSQQFGMLFISEQTFQLWYYRSIPHHLGGNPLPRALPLNITRVISLDLIPQCSAYQACIQIIVLLTMIE